MTQPNRKPALDFNAAFERLIKNKPINVPLGTPVSQNNVAFEAGAKKPSALRADRHPALCKKIAAWKEKHSPASSGTPPNKEKEAAAKRKLDASKKKISKLKAQRDEAQARLIIAERDILYLLRENASLKSQIGDKVTRIRK